MWNPGINVSLKELLDLRFQAQQLSVNGIHKWLKMPGQKLSRMRGRGLEFDATREYQAGDDIRNMAWRVTARSLKPHVKVYQEEKERPVWLALDLSPSLYFGTRSMFKSVSSIKQAALLGWSHLQERELIGAMIATEDKMEIFKPRASESSFMTILHSLSQSSKLQPNFQGKNHLQDLLLRLQQQARSGNLIFILSDFFQFDTETQKLLVHLAQRAQVVMVFVYDPFEAEAPPPHQYILTNGNQKALFNMENSQNRLHYQQQFQLKQNNLLEFSRKHNIALKVICTNEDGYKNI